MHIDWVTENKKRYLDLLLLGDEQEEMIDRYLERGDLLVMTEGNEAIAVCVVTQEGDGVLEIKNLAVTPSRQSRGYGRAMIEHVAKAYAGRGHTLLVGTGDSPLTVPFYERCGFVRSHVIRDFFTRNYDHPIIEAGVQLKDMVVFKRALRLEAERRADASKAV